MERLTIPIAINITRMVSGLYKMMGLTTNSRRNKITFRRGKCNMLLVLPYIINVEVKGVFVGYLLHAAKKQQIRITYCIQYNLYNID